MRNIISHALWVSLLFSAEAQSATTAAPPDKLDKTFERREPEAASVSYDEVEETDTRSFDEKYPRMAYNRDRMKKNMDGAWANVSTSAGRVADNFRDNFHRTVERVEDWWFTPPEVKQPHAVPASYCYRALQDVLCYRQPMPGWEGRLIGYQGTYAAAPPPAVMKPLPRRSVEAEMDPANRVENTVPVFSEIPSNTKDKKSDESTALDEGTAGVTADPSHETLPDPASSPQL